MFEVLTLLRLSMSAATSWRSALFLAILMAIIGPLQMSGNLAVNSSDFGELNERPTVSFSLQGARTALVECTVKPRKRCEPSVQA